jgi:hypothetical protein
LLLFTHFSKRHQSRNRFSYCQLPNGKYLDFSIKIGLSVLQNTISYQPVHIPLIAALEWGNLLVNPCAKFWFRKIAKSTDFRIIAPIIAKDFLDLRNYKFRTPYKNLGLNFVNLLDFNN